MLVCMLARMSVGRVFAVALQKGGVGKTTTAINLAYEFGRAGLSVLLIDLDQQAHATHGLGVDVGGDDATMYEVLHPDRAERVALRDVIKSSQFGVDVAPAAYALRSLERTGLGSGGQVRLARELESLDRYDVVCIDSPPALGDLTVAALAGADDVIATVSPGPDELDAVRVLDNTVLDVQSPSTRAWPFATCSPPTSTAAPSSPRTFGAACHRTGLTNTSVRFPRPYGSERLRHSASPLPYTPLDAPPPTTTAASPAPSPTG